MAKTANRTAAAPAAPARKRAPAPAQRPAPAKKPSAPARKQSRPAPQEPSLDKPADKSALKLVRDGFTMPQQDFDLIAALKKRAIALQRPAKKSELLRAGLHALTRLPDEAFLAALEGLVQLKLGRPKKGA